MQLYGKTKSAESLGDVSRLKIKLGNQQEAVRKLINDNPKVLQRSPRREWAGDMPKINIPRASGRKIDDFLGGDAVGKAIKAKGSTKKATRAALADAMKERGGSLKDFSALTAGEQRSMFRSIIDKIDGTDKANKGKHTYAKFNPAIDVESALDFAQREFGIDRLGTMYKEIGISGANLINEALYDIKKISGSISLRDIRYKATLAGDKDIVAAYNPSWNGLFFSRAIKSKNAAKKLATMQHENYNMGWWATDNPKGVIHHEMGHYFHNRFDDTGVTTTCQVKLKSMLTNFRIQVSGGKVSSFSPGDITIEMAKEAQRIGLSGYSLVNEMEMVAESFAQVFNGNPSEAAKQIVKTVINDGRNAGDKELMQLKRKLDAIC